MEKTISVVEDWLSECNGSEDTEHLIGCIESDKDRLIYAIFALLEERTRYIEIYENCIKQAFIFAKSKDERLREFILLFAPSLINIYLSTISMGEKKSVGNLEYTLLALYNKEVLDDRGAPRVASFRLPTLARYSIYHDPASLAPASYTSDSLHRLEAGDAETVKWGPPKHIDAVTAATRYHLVTALLVAFNARLSKLPKIVLMHLCKSSSKIVCQGFNRPGHHHRSSYGSDSSFGVYPRPVPRIPVTSDLLTELVHAIYFAIPNSTCWSLHEFYRLGQFHFSSSASHNTSSVDAICPALVPTCLGECYHSPKVKIRRFNDFASLGIQALEDIHLRAQYELFPDVLLMTNAIKNSLKVNPSGQLSDGPMGISIALTPSTSAAPLSKSYITNASFRTKKLPDDLLDYYEDLDDTTNAQSMSASQSPSAVAQPNAHTGTGPQNMGSLKTVRENEECSNVSIRRSPQMGINSLKLKSSEVKKLLNKGSDSRKTNNEFLPNMAGACSNRCFDNSSERIRQPSRFAEEKTQQDTTLMHSNAADAVAFKDSTTAPSSINASPNTDAKISILTKSRRALTAGFQNLSPSLRNRQSVASKSPVELVCHIQSNQLKHTVVSPNCEDSLNKDEYCSSDSSYSSLPHERLTTNDRILCEAFTTRL